MLSVTHRACSPHGLSEAERVHRDYRLESYMAHAERAGRPLVYLGGHDHSVQHIEARGKHGSSVHFFVNGAGGYDLHDLDPRCSPGVSAACLPAHGEFAVHAASGAFHGFAVHEVRQHRFDTFFVDASGEGRDVLRATPVYRL